MFSLFKFVVVIVIILAVVGYFQGWYSIEKQGDDSYNVSIDKEKLKSDVSSATDKTKSAVDKIKETVVGEKEFTGKVTKLDLLAQRLTVTADDGDSKTFVIDKSVFENSPADFAALAALANGDQVTVTYEKEEGDKRLIKVTKTP
ncbi:MAG: hypothetical protein KDB53_14220 [Planctomycetes bacterium]|nr:hypothetical protein [Planctomycetota bacterium]